MESDYQSGRNIQSCLSPGYKDVMSRSVFIITAPSSRKPGDPLVISDIKKGSVAHR